MSMKKEIIGYISDIPLGCKLITEIKSINGAQLLPVGTVIDENALNRIKAYHGKLHIWVDIEEDQLIESKQKEMIVRYHLEEKSYGIAESVKEQAKQGVEYLFNSGGNEESVYVAKEISNLLTDDILSSNELNININKLKISDEYTFKHSIDVAVMSSMIGKAMNLDEQKIHEITTAGILHDIGKIDISTEILNKPGKLTEEEFQKIKAHPYNGYNRLKDNKDISEDVRIGILQHHERYFGGGYPLGISGDKIGVIGRILTIADIYDALVTERPYKMAHSPIVAYEMLLAMFNNFEPNTLRVFNNIINLYAVGEIITLSNNEKCIVTSQNEGYPLRPKVRNINTNIEYDLANDFECRSLVIC